MVAEGVLKEHSKRFIERRKPVLTIDSWYNISGPIFRTAPLSLVLSSPLNVYAGDLLTAFRRRHVNPGGRKGTHAALG